MARRALPMVLAAAVFAVMLPGSAVYADIHSDKPKSETVYAVLGNDGTYSGATVVNAFTQDGQIVDYGDYVSLQNLMGPENPLVDGDMITWPAEATQGLERFLYQGDTNRALPFSIHIAYYLNGQSVAPRDIAGKTGELTIEITAKNKTGTGEMDALSDREIFTPFAVQTSLTLNSGMYTVRDIPENAAQVLAGSSYTISYSSFPLPSDTFSFTVFGEKMELEPISFVVLPKAPPGLDYYDDFIDADGMTEGTDEMIEGADDMEQGTQDLLDALQKLRDGAEQLAIGSR